jgi:tRNA-dihydrouridine synthase
VFSDNPVDMAAQWVAQGARRLHLVDLNGAFEGKPMNAASVTQIVSAFPDLPVQIGGGIRNMDIANAYIEAGVGYLIIGTMAVTHPEFVSQLCREFPDQVIVGLDANDGLVATEGLAFECPIQIYQVQSTRPLCYPLHCHIYWIIRKHCRMPMMAWWQQKVGRKRQICMWWIYRKNSSKMGRVRLFIPISF